MSMEPVRTGVIGAGDISTVYLNAISRSPAVDLRKVATRNQAAAHDIAGRYGVDGVGVADLLADDAIEMVLSFLGLPGLGSIARDPISPSMP